MPVQPRGVIRPDQLGEPIDLRPRFLPQRRALIDLLVTLDPREWNTLTWCPGWTVSDVARHLLGDVLARLRGGDGRNRTGPGPGESLTQFIDRSNQEWVDATRSTTPERIIDELSRAGADLDTLWGSADLAAPSIGVSWAGVDPAPAWFDIAREYTEYWVHQTQIRGAVGATPETNLLDPVLDVFARGLPFALRHLDEPPHVTVEATGIDDATWFLRRTPGGWRLAGGPAPAATMVVAHDARYLTRRWVRHPDAAPPAGGAARRWTPQCWDMLPSSGNPTDARDDTERGSEPPSARLQRFDLVHVLLLRLFW